MLVKGAGSLKSGKGALSQVFTYANFEYYTRGTVNILKDGCVNRSFFEATKREGASELCYYLCELAHELSDENVEAEELLRLLLNSLYALSEGRFSERVVKAAFELRAMSVSGYAPQLHACALCGREEGDLYLNAQGGTVNCSVCLSKNRFRGEEDLRDAQGLLPLSPSVLAAMRYCIECPVSRVFSFALEEEELDALYKTAESYVLSHLEKRFVTLEYYYTVKAQPSEMEALLEKRRKNRERKEALKKQAEEVESAHEHLGEKSENPGI
jgi:DNA repair protein RecO (recombination protein O)